MKRALDWTKGRHEVGPGLVCPPMPRARPQVVIVGAGIGGLAAACALACGGAAVTVVERAARVGGKMREVVIDGRAIDSGPTVLTMRGVFDALFEAAGARLDDHVRLVPLEILARHGWSDGSRLDLFADPEASAAAIEAFASPADAAGYRRFLAHTRRIYEVVEGPFLQGPRPTLPRLVGSLGARGLRGALDVDGLRTMWRALGDFFVDPRLRQLFGRYATYYGSSPFAAPATLNLIAHVEQRGVWTVEGGIARLAGALAALATRHGAVIRCGAHVDRIEVAGGRARAVLLAGGERLEAAAIVHNGDAAALRAGLLGPAVAGRRAAAGPAGERSLSALTWSMVARTRGFPLSRHTVFFADDYAAEFRALFAEGRLPARPTVYICAHDRGGAAGAEAAIDGPERLLVLVNAPARGGRGSTSREAIDACEEATFSGLQRAGLTIEREPARCRRTTPEDLSDMFPGTGGAIYGAATHSVLASLRRPTARTRIAGLYLAGGSAHPGAGVPMVALSGRFAAAAVLEDLASTARSPTAATPGGTSTPSPTTGASA